jgi:peptidoglycan-associated lipoprotein
MKTTRILIALSVAALAVGCATTKLEEPVPAPVVESKPAEAPKPAPDTRGVTTVDTAPKSVDPLMDPKSGLAQRSVFFDFDRFDIKPDYMGLVEAHGRYLATNKQRKIVIEGNADERGSREYNLALGQKRADAVKSRLTLLGATDAQIETISYGEERPRATGHDESSWSQNRRADIQYR